MIESQWSILKSEFYDRYEWDTTAEAIRGVQAWIYGFYNRRRLDSSIGYQTPVEFEAHHNAAALQAAA
jgi:transposase InsO family protein